MIFSLAEMLASKAPMINIVDVGAMIIEGTEPEYAKLVARGKANVIGFESVQAECDKLNAMNRKGQKFLPYFIGDGSRRTFHLCNFPMTSSLYEPNTKLLKRFNNLEELTQCVEKSDVQTTRLDDIPEITSCDLLKLDIQGAELDAITGGQRITANALVVESEVEFVEMYRGQPMFADVDTTLRKHGFAFHMFKGTLGRAFKPLIVNGDINRGLRQTLSADAVYVRDFTRFSELTAEQLLKIAIILHDVYQSLDFAALAIQHYDAKTNAGIWKPYMQRLYAGGTPPPPPPLD